jgi:hypothetical protein
LIAIRRYSRALVLGKGRDIAEGYHSLTRYA